MTVHDNRTWAFLRLDPDHRAVQAAVSPPEYEAAPFPVRVRSKGDLAAAGPWRLLAWEDPDGPAMPFWDIPMLDCVLAVDERPLVHLARVSRARCREGAHERRLPRAAAECVRARRVGADVRRGAAPRRAHKWTHGGRGRKISDPVMKTNEEKKIQVPVIY